MTIQQAIKLNEIYYGQECSGITYNNWYCFGPFSCTLERLMVHAKRVLANPDHTLKTPN